MQSGVCPGVLSGLLIYLMLNRSVELMVERPSLHCGRGNFVDLTLKIVVKQAAGTLMAFQPKFPHGTTRLCGAHNRVVAITFSSHILKSYEIAMKGARVEGGAGAGDGHGNDDKESSWST
jgi:hypothetical protein